MENNFTPSTHNGIQYSSENQSNLLEAGKWARFLGIISVVIASLMILGGVIFAFAAGSLLSNEISQLGSISGPLIGVIYIITGLFVLYPSLALMRFGSHTRQGVSQDNQQFFNSGINNLKKYFKFVGIFTAIIIGLYALFFIVILITSAFS